MAYIHNALPYKQKQVLPLMLSSTTHPTTITRFNLGRQSFKTVRMISNNNFLDKPKQYQSSLSPNVCLPYNKSQPRLLNSNNQKVQHYTVFALFVACVASVSVGFPHKFRCFSRAKIGARAKQKEGGGERRKGNACSQTPGI